MSTPNGAARSYNTASDAWAKGDYPSALTEYLRILNSPDSAEYLDRIDQERLQPVRAFVEDQRVRGFAVDFQEAAARAGP